MFTKMNGKIYNCKLYRKSRDAWGNVRIFDNRDVARCLEAGNCETCMWNENYAITQIRKLELRPMTKKQITDLKERNKYFPISETNLRVLKPKRSEL